MLKMPMGKLPIDSKFPLDSILEGDEKKIKASLKKHIGNIASKYILAGETVDCAILFLPSDAIYQEVVAMTDIVLLANSKKVFLSSPTTLLAMLNQLNACSRGIILSQNNEATICTVGKLTNDVERLVGRFEASEKLLERIKTEFGKIQTSIDKIRRHQADLESLGCFIKTADKNKRLNATSRQFNLSNDNDEPLKNASVEDDRDADEPLIAQTQASEQEGQIQRSVNGEDRAVAN